MWYVCKCNVFISNVNCTYIASQLLIIAIAIHVNTKYYISSLL